MRFLIIPLLLISACVIDTVPLPEDQPTAAANRDTNIGGGDDAMLPGPPADAGASGGGTGDAGPPGDVGSTYRSWTQCADYDTSQPSTFAGAQCLCDAANDCTAAWGRTWQDLGSEAFRVCQRTADSCVFSVFSEVEGGGGASLCIVPRAPAVCDAAPLSATELLMEDCTPLYTCNLLMGNCPTELLPCQ